MGNVPNIDEKYIQNLVKPHTEVAYLTDLGINGSTIANRSS